MHIARIVPDAIAEESTLYDGDRLGRKRKIRKYKNITHVNMRSDKKLATVGGGLARAYGERFRIIILICIRRNENVITQSAYLTYVNHFLLITLI